MNIRVVRIDGASAGMREIGLRTVLRLIDGLFLYLVGLIVMLATHERRGRLGDLVGGTMIVSAERPSAVEPITAAPETPAAARVPIAESGPAFAQAEAEPEPEPAEAEVAEVAPAEPAEPEVAPAEPAEPDVASPSLKELASAVTALTEDPDREVEDEPEAEEARTVEVAAVEEPEVEAAEEPEAEDEPEAEGEPEAEDQPAAEADAEPEADEEVTLKSVETVSAIDLVMEDGDEEAVAGSQAKARQG
jgi:FtsZ-interacting cell division protein ZipA